MCTISCAGHLVSGVHETTLHEAPKTLKIIGKHDTLILQKKSGLNENRNYIGEAYCFFRIESREKYTKEINKILFE